MTPANRNLIIRFVSAACLAPPLVVAVVWQQPHAMLAIINVAALLGLLEFYSITLADEPLWHRRLAAGLGLVINICICWLPRRADLALGLICAATIVAAILQMVRTRQMQTAVNNLGLVLFGMLYVSVLLACLGLLKGLPAGGYWVILALTIAFFADTGAYAAGRALGRRKLYPSVSPGKTVEGAIGGLVASFLAGVLAKFWYLPSLGWLDVLLLTVPASALGQAGDLVESMIKRAYGVKDSGKIIPGHGGLLDRIDALLFVGPYLYLYARYIFFGVGR